MSKLFHSSFSSNPFLIKATSSILHKTLSNIIQCDPSTAPSLPLNNYIERLILYTQLELNTLITSLIYIDRYCLKTNTKLTNSNVYRLIISGVLASVKYNEDVIYHMSYYAKVFGVSEKELRKMEREFLMKMKFDLYVKEEVFEQYYEYIWNEVKGIEKEMRMT